MATNNEQINDETRKIIVKELTAKINDKNEHPNITAYHLGQQMQAGHISSKDHKILAELFMSVKYQPNLAEGSAISDLWANLFFHDKIFEKLIPYRTDFKWVWRAIAGAFKSEAEKTLATTLFQYFLEYHKKAPDFPEKMLQALLSDQMQKDNALISNRQEFWREHFLKPVLDLAVTEMSTISGNRNKYDYVVRCSCHPALLAAYLEQQITAKTISSEIVIQTLDQLDIFVTTYKDKIPFQEKDFKGLVGIIINFWNTFEATEESKVSFLKQLDERLTIIGSRDFIIRERMNWVFYGFSDPTFKHNGVMFDYFIHKAFHMRESSSKEEAAINKLFPDPLQSNHNTLLRFADITRITKPLSVWMEKQSFADVFNIAMKSSTKKKFLFKELSVSR